MNWIYVFITILSLQHKSSHSYRRQFIGEFKPSYIVGGRDVSPSKYPHLAAIGFERRAQKLWRCGGTLISIRYVLTAAHCLEDKTYRKYGKALYVRLGDADLKNPNDNDFVQQINVKKRIPHPGYEHPMKYNDVGLLELQDEAVINKFVKPACLHRAHDITQTKAEVVGWGFTEKPNNRKQTLRAVEIDLHPVDKCTERVKTQDTEVLSRILNEGLRDDEMICAGVLTGGKDSCSGDSGGPLQVNSTLPGCSVEIIGIVSFGLGGCAVENTPAVYVRVSNYVPWIESVIKSSQNFPGK